jgi:hypothetical protein
MTTLRYQHGSLSRWIRLGILVLGAAMAAPAVASAQNITIFQNPVRPGEGFAFQADLPEGWGTQAVSIDPRGYGLSTFVQRLFRNTFQCPAGLTCWSGRVVLDDRLQPGDLAITITADVGGGRSRTVSATLHVQAAADDDHDGMPDVWERREGLEPFDTLGTSAPGDDPDHDGISNIDEFRAGTAPMGRYHLHFGSSSPGDRQGMTPFIQAIQADSLAGPIHARFIGDDGRQMITPVNAEGPEVINTGFSLDEIVADRVLAIEIDSYQPLAAERMLESLAVRSPNTSPPGLLSTVRPAEPSTDWYFGTGPTSTPVDAFLLAYNPGSAPVTASLTYYRSADEAPVVTQRVLAPGRTTIWINADEPQLAGRDFAVAVHADAAVLFDRGFRRQPPGRTAPQEQTGPGANALSPQWYFPRVRAVRELNERIVLANPGDRACGIEVATFGETREPRVSYVTVGPHARTVLRASDIGVDGLGGVRLTTNTGVPFVAEILQESFEGEWLWTTPGTTEVGTTWAMALIWGGQIDIFNPADVDADVEVKAWYTPTYGTASQTVRVHVPARRMAIVHSYNDPDAAPGAPTVTGQTVAIRSLPLANGQPGPGIVVGRGTSAGANGAPNARIDPAIATRVR